MVDRRPRNPQCRWGGRTPLYPSGGRVLKHAREVFAGLDRLTDIIVFDPTSAEGLNRGVTLETVEARGAAIDRKDPKAFDRILGRGRPEDLATIIYTSGTTGEPKGVMLTQNNFISNVRSITVGLPISPADVSLSVLPLSHIFERSVFYVFCYVGVSVHYAASIEQVGEFLREVRPTIMTAVPRLFEKVYHRIVKKGMTAGGMKSKIFERSLAVGQQYAELKYNGKPIPLALKARQAVADRLVFG